jgi:hypothetical protein
MLSFIGLDLPLMLSFIGLRKHDLSPIKPSLAGQQVIRPK